jgi:dual specificity phosphatase 3
MNTTALQYANASRITSQLWIGGDLEVGIPMLALIQLEELDQAGVTDIVDVRLEWNDEDWVTAAKPHLRYCWLGVDDAGQLMPDAWFDTGTDYVLTRVNSGGRVLVHCHMGINRGPSMGYAAMLALGWDPVDALDRIRAARPIAYVAYAEDALDWWLRKNGDSTSARRVAERRLQKWRGDNDLDVAGVIRRIRMPPRPDDRPELESTDSE